MPMFRVVMSKPTAHQPNLPRNPFLIRDIFSPRWSQKRLQRTWEFEADSEAAVRELLADARKEGISEVDGFDLDRIEQLHATVNGDA